MAAIQAPSEAVLQLQRMNRWLIATVLVVSTILVIGLGWLAACSLDVFH